MASLALPADAASRRAASRALDAAELSDQPERPRAELGRARPEIHHPVAVDLAEPGEGPGGERIERELGRRPRLEPRRAGQDLRSDGERDDDAGAPARHVRIARHEHGRRPAAPRLAERAVHEGGHPARRDPHDDVAGARPPPHLTRAGRPVVLGALHGAEDGAAAPGDDGLDERGRRVERGRALRGLDHAEPAAGARAHEHEPAAPRQRAHDELDGPADGGRGASHGVDRAAIGAVHELRDPER